MSGQERDLRSLELLYPVALRILGQPAEAEEAVQEAWLQAWRGAAGYDPRRGSVAAWLLTMTRSRALDRVRARASKGRFETDDVPSRSRAVDPEPGQDQRFDRDERRRRVRGALSQLDPNHRKVLEFAYFEGLSQSLIASRLERPLGTIKSWTREGLTRLRSILDSADAGGAP